MSDQPVPPPLPDQPNLKTTYNKGDKLGAGEVNLANEQTNVLDTAISQLSQTMFDTVTAVNNTVTQVNDTTAKTNKTVLDTNAIVTNVQQNMEAVSIAQASHTVTLSDLAVRMTNLESSVNTTTKRVDALETAAPPPTVAPGQVVGLAAGVITESSIAVSWTATATAVDYVVQYQRVGSPTITSMAPAAPTTRTITGLSSGPPAYSIQVYARNAGGNGPVSAGITATTTTLAVPSANFTEITNNDGKSIIMDDGAAVSIISGVMRITPVGGVLTLMGSTSLVDLAVITDTRAVFHRSTNTTPTSFWRWDGTTWQFSAGDPRPAPPGTTVKAQILTWLKSIETTAMISGQFSHAASAEFDAVTNATGKTPGFVMYDPWSNQWGTPPYFIFDTGFSLRAKQHWAAGGLIGMNGFFPNPAGGPSQSTGGANAAQILTPGSAQYNQLNVYISQMATVLLDWKANNIAPFVRIMIEQDGGWFWWGSAVFSQAQQVQLWNQIWDRLINTHGCDHCIKIFNTNGTSGYTVPTGTHAPDIVSFDAYTDSFDTPIFRAAYDLMIQRAPNALIARGEFGSGTPSAVNPNYDLRTFVNMHKPGGYFRKMIYAMAWTGWGWNQMAFATAALSDPYMKNLDNLGRPVIGPVTPVPGTRLAYDIPYASASVANIGMGNNATWGAGGDVDVTELRSLNMAINDSSFSIPVYRGFASDPLVTVTCEGHGGVPGEPFWPFSIQMRVPAGAQPAAGTDRHMFLWDDTQRNVAVVIAFAQCPQFGNLQNGSVITSFLGALLDVTKNGISRAEGDFLGTDNYAWGLIRTKDITDGVIKHMIRFSSSVDSVKRPESSPGVPAPAGSGIGVPWPNFHVDYDTSGYSGSITAGCTIGIPAAVNIASLGLSTGGLILATCLQNYGAVWRDSGGTNQFTFYVEPALAGNAMVAQMRADAAIIKSVINIMRNQSTNGAAGTINGGGTSRVPLLPPIGG